MRIKPLESIVQDLVYQVDAGMARKILQRGLFIFFALGVMATYTFTRFNGLADSRAMEYGQLARNYAQRGQLVTKCIRPFSLWYMNNRAPNLPPKVGLTPEQLRAHNESLFSSHPELFLPPAYPILLSGIFQWVDFKKIDDRIGQSTLVYPADYIQVVVNHIFVLLTGLIIFLMAWRMFDRRVGTLSAAAYYLSAVVWDQSIQGVEITQAVFFSTLSLYFALRLKMLKTRRTGTVEWWKWLPLCVLCALSAAIAFLTRYACAVMVPVILSFVIVSRIRGSVWRAFLIVGLWFLFVAPWWIRNYQVAGHPFGLTHYTTLAQSFLAPHNTLMRNIPPMRMDFSMILQALQVKIMGNLRAILHNGLNMWPYGILVAFFIAAYFHRFVRNVCRQLRWCLVPGVILLWVGGALFGEVTMEMMSLFWPVMIIYAWSFVMILLDRLKFDIRFFPLAAMSIIMSISALPLVLNVIPPRAPIPYPPYYFQLTRRATSHLEANEVMTTDMPWATAWYGDRTSLLLPQTLEGFYEVNIFYKKINAAYFTSLTRDQPWVRSLLDRTAPDYTWYPILMGNIPNDFPLSQGFPMAGNDQLFLADRRRW